MLYWRLLVGSLIAKVLVGYRGLKLNCLLTRYPIYWLNPSFKDCIHLARLREHGFQVYATTAKSSIGNPAHFIQCQRNSLTSKHQTTHSSCLQLEQNYSFPFLLNKIIELAEKDLLEL